MNKYLALVNNKTKIKCIGIVLLACLSSVLASVWPVKLSNIYTTITEDISSFSKICSTIAIFGAIYLLSECITIIRRVLIECIISSHEADLRDTNIEKMMKMPVSFYSNGLSGERTAQLNQGIAGLSSLIKLLCNDVISTILTAVCTIIQVLFNAPGIIAIIMLVYLLLNILLSISQIHSQNGIREDIIGQKNAFDGQVCQSISNLELIRSMNAEGYEKERLRPRIEKIRKTETKHHTCMGSYDCAKQVCKVLFQILILFASILLVIHHNMSAASVITVCLLFQQLVKPIDEVYRFLDDIASSIIKARILVDITSASEDPIYSIIESNSNPPLTSNDIVFQDVTVTNPEKNKCLAKYKNITIPNNSIVAIKGPSGSGKTSLMRCLNRFYPYSEGTVKIFGRDLASYSQKELTDRLFYTPQKAFFFAGTIKDNLIYGMNQNVTTEKLIYALKNVCLYEVLKEKVNKNPDSDFNDESILSYQIGEGGKGLSGGECQRLAIARAFLREPNLFIFDESTANLDISTAQTVLNNIEIYAKKICAGIVYISHNNEIFDRCQQIITLENLIKPAI